MTAAKPARTYKVNVEKADAGERLDRLLATRLPELSRSRLKNLIEAGRLSAGGETIVEPSYRVKPGQRLTLRVPAAVPARPQAQAMPLDILYEDSDLIVINKPAGLVVDYIGIADQLRRALEHFRKAAIRPRTENERRQCGRSERGAEPETPRAGPRPRRRLRRHLRLLA